jgi:cobalt-zinc-cadmium efflux system outer membrane protein
MSISVQSANAQKSSITLENALKRTLSNNPDLVVFEFKSSALDGESKMASLRPEMSVGVDWHPNRSTHLRRIGST